MEATVDLSKLHSSNFHDAPFVKFHQCFPLSKFCTIKTRGAREKLCTCVLYFGVHILSHVILKTLELHVRNYSMCMHAWQSHKFIGVQILSLAIEHLSSTKDS